MPDAAEQDRQDDLVFPRKDLRSILELAPFLEHQPEPALLVGRDGEQMSLPPEVYRVLRHAVAVMRQGKATYVAPQNLVLTTQEAADLLDVSRPTLVKLLESARSRRARKNGDCACPRPPELTGS